MRVVIINKKILLLILFIIISITIILNNNEKVLPTMYLPITDKVIAIDAGHGGFDPGAIGSKKHEDDINMEIVLRLRRLIEQGGGVVILTREEDIGLNTEKSKTYRQKKNEDLRNRRILINNSEADVFLSIHLNSFPQSKYYGAQTFYKKGCESSKILAKLIQQEFRNVLDKNNKRRPQARDSVYIIREAESPAVLVECGFLSNPNEERLLNQDKYQEKVAWAIYVGLVKYFKDY
ncbi:MAG: N-acetylmuramoyl-L-alanine amidase CwlD [Firmicutes bacterium]|nr:N-acetylmuramoyl-L-alanine amidase CwlD [Bacillota bacterium]